MGGWDDGDERCGRGHSKDVEVTFLLFWYTEFSFIKKVKIFSLMVSKSRFSLSYGLLRIKDSQYSEVL